MPGNPSDPASTYYQYSGRIDFSNPSAPSSTSTAWAPILFTAAAIETAADKAYPCIQQVADTLRAEGLRTALCRFKFRVSGHPNRVEHQAMAEELYRFILKKGC